MELISIILALRIVPLSFSKIILFTDGLSVCLSLGKGDHSIKFVILARVIPVPIKCIRVIWVPSHVDFTLNETSDALAVASLMCTVREVLPLIGYFESSRYRRLLEVQRRQN